MATASTKVNILFIAANPPGELQLDSGTEKNRLEDALAASQHPALFDVRSRDATRTRDIEPSLRQFRPQVIHFSGHGAWPGDVILNASDGETSFPLSAEDFAEKLGRYIRDFQAAVHLVVLAGCYTDRAAQLLCEHVDCAVGMADRVDDTAMVDVFTPVLYRALGDGSSVEAAVADACLELRLNGFQAEAEAVRLHARPGVDPAKFHLTEITRWQPESEQRRLSYLRSLFGENCAWSMVSMSLFAGQDTRLARRVPLLDIFTPLPVDFAITMELTDNGPVTDWWCGNVREEYDTNPELQWFDLIGGEQLARVPLEQAREKSKLRQRKWTDLDVDETRLQPLLELAFPQGGKPAQVPSRSRATTQRWQADASHAALVQPRFVLIGDPGSGKSTFLRHLALCWAGQLLHEADQNDTPTAATLDALPGWRQAYTPIYIELRPLVDTFAPMPDDADQKPDSPGLSELRGHLKQYLPAPNDESPIDDSVIDHLFDLLRQGRAALLLDGLDEVSQASAPWRRAQVHGFVNTLDEEFPTAPIIITARPYAYDQEGWMMQGFGHTRLAPLDADRQAQFARRIFERLLRYDRRRTAGRETDAFVNALRHIPQDLRSNPLLLTLLAALWFRRNPTEQELPSTRGQLYRQAVDLLVKDWATHKGYRLPLDGNELQAVLELIAFDAQERRRSSDEPAIIMRRDILAALDKIEKLEATKKLFDHLEQQAGMLLEQVPGLVNTYDQQYKFLHLSFQEYLAGCELLHRTSATRRAGLPVFPTRGFPEGLRDRMLAAPLLWANVLRLAVDELLATDRALDAWELLGLCCAPYQDQRDEHPVAAVLAMQVTLDAKLFEKPLLQGAQEHYEVLKSAAKKALEDYSREVEGEERPCLSPEQRDVAGKLLGSIQKDNPLACHDPRPGVGLRQDGLPDIDWVIITKVEGQTGKSGWTYQDKKHEPLDTFWMARYPITYAQFQTFLDARDGFRHEPWWDGLAASQEHRSRPGEQRFNHWNHPRENVSWYDAIAFCRWLTAKAKERLDLLPADLDRSREWEITLPTEQQWEKAARGHDGRQYPWGGDKYKSGYANIDETWSSYKVGQHYLQKTSAVGMYPQGVSPYGVADLSGNVWEWCLNEYETGKTDLGGDARRVLRGGPGHIFAYVAAASVRNRSRPVSRYRNFGFRVVVVGWRPNA